MYLTYRTELDKVKQVPGLKSQIDEFRMRNFALQSSMDNDFDKLDRIEKDYEDFRANPLVADFLAAELDLCRMIQGIVMKRFTAILAALLEQQFGGIIGCFFDNVSNKLLSFILSFASGLMMAVICFDLIPEALGLANILIIIITFPILIG